MDVMWTVISVIVFIMVAVYAIMECNFYKSKYKLTTSAITVIITILLVLYNIISGGN